MRFTYSHRSEATDSECVTADDWLSAVGQDALADGDLDGAITRTVRDGVMLPGERWMPGIDELLRTAAGPLTEHDALCETTAEQPVLGMKPGKEWKSSLAPPEGTSDDPVRVSPVFEAYTKSTGEVGPTADPALESDPTAVDIAFHAAVDELGRIIGGCRQRALPSLAPNGHAGAPPMGASPGDVQSGVDSIAAGGTRVPSGACAGDSSREHPAGPPSGAQVVVPDDEASQVTSCELGGGAMASGICDGCRTRVRDRLLSLLSFLRPKTDSMPAGEIFTAPAGVVLDSTVDLVTSSDLQSTSDGVGSMRELRYLDLLHLRQLLGDHVSDALHMWASVAVALEDAGYATHTDGSVTLTPRGMHRIGLQIVDDLQRRLTAGGPGMHDGKSRGTRQAGNGATRPLQPGDDFQIDLGRSLANAVRREGTGVPLRMSPGDFEYMDPDQQGGWATVLLLDISRSMPLRGYTLAARRLALALSTLIRDRFPRDTFYVLVVADRAIRVRPDQLHHFQPDAAMRGTNLQHGLLEARRLLGHHRAAERQIVLVTDGEPTAYFQEGALHYAYPPTRETFQRTIREVQHCARDEIAINTFMLGRDPALVDFVRDVTRVGRGRAFFVSTDSLTDYLVVDYLQGRLNPSRRVNSRL